MLGMFTSPLQSVTEGGVTGATTEEALTMLWPPNNAKSFWFGASPLENLGEDDTTSLTGIATSLGGRRTSLGHEGK